jgi:hypothetical protein
MRAIRNWVTVEDGPDAAVWVTKDAPLVMPGTISLPYAPFPASTSPVGAATIYSWVHNNVWDTNFPIEQGFDATFEYAIGVRARPDQHVEAVALATTAELVRPLTAVPAGSVPGGDERASVELMTLSDDRVRLVAIVADGDDSSLVQLQSVADQATTVTLALGGGVVSAERSTYLGDALGPLELDGSSVRVDLQPYEAVAVRVRRRTA